VEATVDVLIISVAGLAMAAALALVW
jgi:hypothetical protein